MLRRLLVIGGIAFAVAACQSSQQAAAPPAAPPPPPQKVWMVFFDFGSAAVTPEGKATVAEATTAARSMANAKVQVTGFTDTVGTEAANKALAQRRANAVRDALVASGVAAQSITVVGAGEASQLVPTPDQTKEGRNRRVQILVQ
jgi:OOP family OmpA-OmpF porin